MSKKDKLIAEQAKTIKSLKRDLAILAEAAFKDRGHRVDPPMETR